MTRRLVLATALLASALVLFPGIDLAVSSWFWRQPDRFFLAHVWPLRLVFHSIAGLTLSVVAVLIAIHVARRRRGIALFGIDRRQAWYLTVALLTGPLLAVDLVLKPLWGRGRPYQVVPFGGDLPFTSIGAIVTSNGGRSFPSGHAAIVFYLFAFCAVLPAARRQRAEQRVVVAGLAVGLCRVMQGGHFLSDVVFTGILMYAMAYALHRVMVGAPAGRGAYDPVGVNLGGRGQGPVPAAQNRPGSVGTDPS